MTTPTMTRKPVEELFRLFDGAWKTNDGGAVAGLYVEDGSLINPFGQRADGSADIAAMYSDYFAGMLRGTSITTRLDSVRLVGPDHAFADGEQTIIAAGGEVVLVVHLTALLGREGEAWRFVDSRPYSSAGLPA